MIDFKRVPITELEIPNYIDTLIKQHFERAIKQKEDFLKSKITEKGFGHLIPGIEKRMFPKIAAISKDGWTYYYADNDTEEGLFVVAIEDWNFKTEIKEDNFGASMYVSFNWQDTKPLVRFPQIL